MKTTNRTIFNLLNPAADGVKAVEKIKNTEISGLDQFVFKLNLSRLQAIFDPIRETQIALIKKYGKTDKDGVLSMPRLFCHDLPQEKNRCTQISLWKMSWRNQMD